jgi:hypothetical protein
MLAAAAVNRKLSMVWWRWHIGVSELCCCWSMVQKAQYGLMTLAYQRFRAVLLLIYGTESSVWFDDVGILAFQSCAVVDLWYRKLSMVWWRWHIGVSELCCCWSMVQKAQYGLMTLAYQRFRAVLLLIYGTESSVWFDDVRISAFQSCAVVNLW